MKQLMFFEKFFKKYLTNNPASLIIQIETNKKHHLKGDKRNVKSRNQNGTGKRTDA